MTDTAQLKIDIVSDVVCPWCVIGYKQVEKALAMIEAPVDAVFWWHPFELNRDMPPEGQDVAEHIQQKYGSTPNRARRTGSVCPILELRLDLNSAIAKIAEFTIRSKRTNCSAMPANNLAGASRPI